MPTDSLSRHNSRANGVSFFTIAAFVCVFAAIFLAFYVFDIRNKERINLQNAHYAEDCAIQLANRVSGRLNNARGVISSYAHFLERMNREPEMDPALLAELEGMGPFESMLYMDPRGSAIAATGPRKQFPEPGFLKDAMRGENGVAVLPALDNEGHTSFVFYAPVRYNGAINGVLCGIISADKYLGQALQTSYFGQRAGVYLCSPDGQTITSSPGEWIRGALLKSLVEDHAIEEATAREAELILKDGGRGSFISVKPGYADNFCITGVPDYDFSLAQIFPAGVTAAMLRQANRAGLELEIFLILVFSSFSVWLLWNSVRTSKKLKRENDEFSEVLNGLDTLFNSRYCRADLESGEYAFVVGAGPEETGAKRRGSFAELLYSHANECASEREQADFRLFFALDNVIAQLKDRNFFTYECHVRRDGAELWENLITICLNRVDGNASRVLFLRQNVTELKQREYAAQRKIAGMDRRERQYQLAITSSAICAFEFNVTRDLVSQTLFQEKNGQKISMLARLGMEAPCRASDIFIGWAENVLPDSRAEYDKIMNMAYLLASFNAGDSAVELDYWMKDPFGKEICVRHAFYLTRDVLSADIMGLSVIKDITVQVTRQREQTQSLQEALMQARHANRAKTVFLSNMSHDIRTPMNAIIGFSTIAANHLDNRELVADSLRKVLSSSNHLLNLINDILDMSRIESGKMQLKERECNISELTHNLVSIIQPQVKAKQLQLFIDTFEVINEDVILDPLKLNQVLINLLSNATKYTHSGGSITIRITQKPAFRHGYAEYTFIVADNGIGMSKEFVKHIFEPFTRETTSTISGIQGTGLGMAITHNIVEMMGGTIEVESEPGKGSRFIIKMEVKLCDTHAPSPRMPELEGMHSLVVDDDFNVCDSVDKMLKRLGLRSEWASSGHEAVHRAKIAHRNGEPFTIFIIDWQMPDMNGVETARNIRRAVGEDMPIIVLTAYDWSDIEEEAHAAGVTAFCAKPLFMSDLKNALLTALSGKKEKEAEKAPKLQQFSGRRILLVDDVEMNREIAEFVLKESGFQVDCAPDGTDAVDMVRNSPENYYDLVLMDIQMPIMNGYEASRAIRSLSRNDVRALPIIAMTANAMEEDRAEAIKNGLDDHIAKPLDIKNFLKVLEKFVKPETPGDTDTESGTGDR